MRVCVYVHVRACVCVQVDLAGSEKWNTKIDMVKAHQSELVAINKVTPLFPYCLIPPPTDDLVEMFWGVLGTEPERPWQLCGGAV